jgi:tetratricopeptide (TPR) repeat protein
MEMGRALAFDPAPSLCYLHTVAPKKIRGELKAPDHFVSFWGRAGTWLAERRRLALAVLAGAVILVFVGWGLQGLGKARAERASRAFARIQRVAVVPLVPASGETPAEPAATPDPDLPRVKTERERMEATLKETDRFLAEHGGSPLRDQALLLKARQLVGLGRATEAVPIYSELVGSLDRRLQFLALEGLAYAQEASGQLDKAVAAFARLADHSREAGNFLRDRALFNQARVLERKGSAKEAEKIYRTILSEVPQSALKEDVNARIAVLEGK